MKTIEKDEPAAADVIKAEPAKEKTVEIESAMEKVQHELIKVYGRVISVDSMEVVLKSGKTEYYFKCSANLAPGLEVCQTAEIYYYIDGDVLVADSFKVIKESNCYSVKKK